MAETSVNVLKAGAGILAVQNILLFLGVVTANISFLEYSLYIDMLGFLLLGVAYIIYAQQEGGDQKLLYAGVAIEGWLIARIIWRYVLVDQLFDLINDLDLDAVDNLVDTIQNMAYAYLFGGLFLLIAFYFVWNLNLEGGTILFVYGVINFIGVFLLVFPLLGGDDAGGGVAVGVILKMLVVPILGIIAFFMLFSKAEDHLYPMQA